jgi:V/A-type H+/Na+-transporting ATPase subunit A
VDEGEYTVDHQIAVVANDDGTETNLTMVQKWPVKVAIGDFREKPRPFKLLETGVRCMDTLNPITEGGTGFIPGPFGTGKTVLQHAISKQAEADIVIIAACGERANEVVEVFTEFPELEDPRTGKKLIERTIIIANTSNMPVAAREASVYTAMTIGEYYRAMGLKVLLWQIPPRGGHRRCVRCRTGWKNFPDRMRFQWTCRLLFQTSIHVQVLFS